MSELHHECGLVAIYHLPGVEPSPLCPEQGAEEVSRLVPRMLLDIQNRGQLSAGMTVWNPNRSQLLTTYKEVGSVSEVFRMGHRGKYESLMEQHTGRAAIGHVRYATCGAEDLAYAQPLERPHIQKRKWFAFGFNGQLANYPQLRAEILADDDNHLARDNDTEVIMHAIGKELSGDADPDPIEMLAAISKRFDGAWNIAMLDACGRMIVARDPLGIRPMEYARMGPLVAAASESVALLNLGFPTESIHSLEPGMALIVDGTSVRIERFAESPKRAHCFFEWVYFANVASTMDDRSVYLTRKRLGEELARLETITIDADTVVVPVPDTSKAAADAMAYKLSIPSVEGLIRNRYTGRTFIDGASSRRQKAETKYTPLREVLKGKRVILVEDSIVRSTTMRVLLGRMRSLGLVREIHVRIACPPIVAPCFYGIDMSTIDELFAPAFLHGGPLTEEAQDAMAAQLGADSLRYLPIESVARSIGFDESEICQACLTGHYPTPAGERLYEVALHVSSKSQAHLSKKVAGRTYESVAIP
ncbi:MAG: amidophosphoribosyltransferase [Planctomycetota bacterium]|nr:MAG: amidophosphoribosyltransferase [Planctomycetota bacterium]